MKSIDISNREIILKNILSEFEKKVTGESIKRVLGNPLDKFFVGRLSPVTETTDEKSSKTFVHQLGIEFFQHNESEYDGVIVIRPNFDLYVRVLPTYEEQCVFMRSGKDSFDINADRREGLVEVFEKISVSGLKFDINMSSFESVKKIKYVDLIKEHRINDRIEELELYYNRELKCTNTDVASRSSWSEFINRNEQKERIYPSWDVELVVNKKKVSKDLSVISVTLFNNTVEDENFSSSKLRRIVSTIFNAQIEVELNEVNICSKDLIYFQDDYKYDSKVLFSGINTNLEHEKFKEKNYSVITKNIPMYIQKKLKTRDAFSKEYLILFDDLIQNPISTLKRISLMMAKELKEWEKYYNTAVSDNYTEKAIKQIVDEIDGFRQEIKRYEVGIECIESYSFVRESFILMNKVFSMNSKGYKSWRLFQLVFIVLQILDLHAIEEGEEIFPENKVSCADILYFPTGGGKTEAFLGITVFGMFYDRFRGKSDGVTAIIKYPLRLLSVQQVQRVAEVVAASEKLRREHQLLADTSEYSIGYFVGDINTPNKVDKRLAEKLISCSQESLNEDYRIIDVCPFCGSLKVDIEFDIEKHRLKHICRCEKCDSTGNIPIYIVDNEVYRYLPTVIISTIDKLAAIGMQQNFRSLFGGKLNKCIHGYTSKGKCIDNICESNMLKPAIVSKGSPTLLIQDELHLVRESLGTFDGHYETLFAYFIENLVFERSKIKVIGATATISLYEEQINNLYRRESILFPSKSIFKDENFYSKVDENEINRIIIGFAPYGKAIINSVVYSMKYLREVIDYYYNNVEIVINMDGMNLSEFESFHTQQKYILKILEDYWIFLQYNNVKLDSNKVLNAIDGVINSELRAQENTVFDYRKMTGDDKFQDVKKILAEVEAKDTNIFKSFNLISATSMISHGVDANRFNLMFFLGMPGNTAEYIQAYSRVGRASPGLVIDILRPSRDRDISYLKYFKEFHEFQNIMVEPVPINRWATKAVESSLPGILTAILINHIDNERNDNYGSIHYPSTIKRLIEDGSISMDKLIYHIERAYGIRDEDSLIEPRGMQYQQNIHEGISRFIKHFKENDFMDKNEFLSDIVFKVFQKKAMTSMRDTEKQVIITLK